MKRSLKSEAPYGSLPGGGAASFKKLGSTLDSWMTLTAHRKKAQQRLHLLRKFQDVRGCSDPGSLLSLNPGSRSTLYCG